MDMKVLFGRCFSSQLVNKRSKVLPCSARQDNSAPLARIGNRLHVSLSLVHSPVSWSLLVSAIVVPLENTSSSLVIKGTYVVEDVGPISASVYRYGQKKG